MRGVTQVRGVCVIVCSLFLSGCLFGVDTGQTSGEDVGGGGADGGVDVGADVGVDVDTDVGVDVGADPCDGVTCNDHGSCEADPSQTLGYVCGCDERFTGDDCGACEPGYAGPACQQCARDYVAVGMACVAATCEVFERECPATLECVDDGAIARCACAPGFVPEPGGPPGGRCVRPCDALSPEDACDESQECVDVGDMSMCTCRPGEQDNDGDQVCSPACSETTCAPTTEVCDDAGGEAKCSCAEGFQDNDNNDVCVPACSETTCGSTQVCDDSLGAVVCACPPGTQDNDNDGTCEVDCASAGCDVTQVCDDTNGSAVCSCPAGTQDNDNDGVCEAECDGMTCLNNLECSDVTGAAVCSCPAGTQDNDGDQFCAPACGGATCDVTKWCDDSSGAAACSCPPGTQDSNADGVCNPTCDNLTCNPYDRCFMDASTGVPYCAGPPNSCAEVAQVQANAVDREYTVYFQGNPNQPWNVYCDDMAGARGGPFEYLTLPNTAGANNNFEHHFTDSQTKYQRVRVDPNTLQVLIQDKSFSTTSKLQGPGPYDPNSLPVPQDFATASSCFNGDPNGTGTVNLEGTPFSVDDRFGGVGFCAAGSANFSSGNQVVGLSGGGQCGDYAPISRQLRDGDACNGIPADPTASDVYTLQLKYDPALFVPRFPSTCVEYKQANPTMFDGEYRLFLDRDPARPWRAFCFGMSGAAPVEYLTLPFTSNGDNVVRDHRNDTQSQYTRVRIDPIDLEIVALDPRFSTPSVLPSPTPNGPGGNIPLYYASAASCGNQPGNNDPPGTARINLVGTPFAVADTFGGYGTCAVVTQSFSSDDQVVELSAIGSGTSQCGVVVSQETALRFGDDCPSSPRPAQPGSREWRIKLRYDAALANP